MRNKQIIRRITIVAVIIIVLSSCMLLSTNIKRNAKTILASNATLSNEKIRWGVKRVADNKQPDLGKENMQLLNKYYGIAMGNSQNKHIYLTFDEGYEAGYTEKLLNTLKENDVKATFFITAHYLNTQENLVKRMLEEGHIVGNHTVNHKSMPSLTDEQVKEEVMKLHTAIYDKFGYEMKYIRPPKGELSERTISITNNLGYTTVMWSLAYDDWNEKQQKGIDYAKAKVLQNIHPGAVILLHGNSKDNADSLADIIKETKNMGYEFKSLDEFER